MTESEKVIRDDGAVALVHPDYRERVKLDWFSASYWGKSARQVSSGGRGGAWFIQAGDLDLVLREYRRGGLAARISQKTYVYTKERAVRSFSEFRLLQKLHGMDFPVPKPVAALYKKTSLIQYQASIIVERLRDAITLAEVVGSLDTNDWQNLGVVIRAFHEANVRHADLNCFNVMVHDGRFYLIDFDRGRIMPENSDPNWKTANLERFARSLRKVAGERIQARIWDSFIIGYKRSPAA
ncbi:3-deoxy-D-manno-octulosonic acid kinase [Marinobacter salexigens]|uniref:3-deoxy-D-manno-octulosonic acid kinase n=1 Tax=Marinobacter salexigens TaxID=1925763 RepID=UPI000C29209B|nr:3-deoxy-D-manno-octulosonic acid kinase [Marinobacter salexigens]